MSGETTLKPLCKNLKPTFIYGFPLFIVCNVGGWGKSEKENQIKLFSSHLLLLLLLFFNFCKMLMLTIGINF